MDVQEAEIVTVAEHHGFHTHLVENVDVAGQQLDALVQKARVHGPVGVVDHALVHVFHGEGFAGLLQGCRSTEAVPVISLNLEAVALPLLVTTRMLPTPDWAAS